MSDYIEREALLENMDRAMRELSVEDLTDPDDWLDAAEIATRECVYNAPAADVAPVVHGRWVYNSDDFTPKKRCTHCGYNKPIAAGIGIEQEPEKFCPNCGARMDGGTQ